MQSPLWRAMSSPKCFGESERDVYRNKGAEKDSTGLTFSLLSRWLPTIPPIYTLQASLLYVQFVTCGLYGTFCKLSGFS